MAGRSGRHRAQAGTTLIELVVSVLIIGLALLLLVGSFSSALVDVTAEKLTTVAQAAVEFELQEIQAAQFDSSPQGYSECFATDGSVSPSCGSGSIVRADATEQDVQPGIQQWTVQVRTYPAGGAVGSPVSIYKINQ